jgi:hypothetical protein
LYGKAAFENGPRAHGKSHACILVLVADRSHADLEDRV